MKTNTTHAPAPYIPLPEAASLAKLLATDTSVDAMAAVLSGFLRSREKSHQKEIKALRDALENLTWAIGERSVGKEKLSDLFPVKLAQAREALSAFGGEAGK